MPRRERQMSKTGIYHIMLRGINQQNIFEDEEDFEKMLEIISEIKDISGFKIFAYCFMQNHYHVLMKVEAESLEKIFKRVGVKYVYWYNLKYKRVGHLFQDRFKSEPIETDRQFLAVLRYIHQNPIKAGMCDKVSAYRWSSYKEYIEDGKLIDSEFVFSLLSLDEFIEFHEIEGTEHFIDYKEKQFGLTDTQAKEIIYEISKCNNASEFQQLTSGVSRAFIKKFKEAGMSIRQISRLTGVSKGIVERT